jgi:SAM-dependent methyltransferase
MHARPQEAAYASRLAEERHHYDNVEQFDDLPPIFPYWSHTFVRPMLEAIGCSGPKELFARYLREGARRSGALPAAFASIGSGDGNNEIDIARQLRESGLHDFTIECLEMNPALIDRAAAAARNAGLAKHFVFTQSDFNTWEPNRTYEGIVANQSLHHVTNLEGLLDAVRVALAPGAYFVTSDIIGRNGHQRWPEALRLVERFWRELPLPYRFHRQLLREEGTFEDWDCSSEGFEGIRSQDILALLLERFAFDVFIGFGSAIDPFVDRGFGPNFDACAQWDRAFIDRVHACDERGLLDGHLTPTHMMAVLSNEPVASPYYARGLAPQACVRDPNRILTAAEAERADRALDDCFAAPEHWLPLRGRVRQSGDVRGWFEDDWAGRELEFHVLPEAYISVVRANVTLPQWLPAGAVLTLDVNGAIVDVVIEAPSATLCLNVAVPAGELTAIRISTSETVNLNELGMGEDVRDLGFHLDEVVFTGP